MKTPSDTIQTGELGRARQGKDAGGGGGGGGGGGADPKKKEGSRKKILLKARESVWKIISEA